MSSSLLTERYLEQFSGWPQAGRHIMAQFNETTLITYQAFRPEIGNYAAKHLQFGGAFSYSRMSWIKPNFLWMMYRSGWASKENQEVILAITIRRSFFDEILRCAVPSTFNSRLYGSQEDWKNAVAESDVRLQWDPDHAPDGSVQKRRAIQLGLRGKILARFGREEAIHIQNISEFVTTQREFVNQLDKLETPVELPYLPQDELTCKTLSLDTP